mgnify:FL=1
MPDGPACRIVEMAKAKIWLKRRTSRGEGRQIKHQPRLNPRNLDRDIQKNQLIYSHYLLKYVVLFAIGLCWLRIGIVVGPLTSLPVGLITGLVVVSLERFRTSRKIELAILLVAGLLSYFLPVGLVL